MNNIMFGMKDDSHKIDPIYYIQFLLGDNWGQNKIYQVRRKQFGSGEAKGLRSSLCTRRA